MTVIQLRVAELTNHQLDAMVAHVEGRAVVTEQAVKVAGCDDLRHYWLGRASEIRYPDPPGQFYSPSRNWSQGGAIIEREHIRLDWRPHLGWRAYPADDEPLDCLGGEEGPTPLVAAMRAFLVARVGETVELPA